MIDVILLAAAFVVVLGAAALTLLGRHQERLGGLDARNAGSG